MSVPFRAFGADRGIRTLDLFITSESLYRLSYISKFCYIIIGRIIYFVKHYPPSFICIFLVELFNVIKSVAIEIKSDVADDLTVADWWNEKFSNSNVDTILEL